MSKQIEPLLKIMILLMFWISIMRIRYIWVIKKIGHKESSIVFRNQEGDWSILFFVLLVMNKSRFDRFQFAYQPFLRHFYAIVVGLFIVYTVLQLTQFVVMTSTTLMTQEAIIDSANMKQYKVKKQIYGYKFTVGYVKKEKQRSLSFFTATKNKEIIEKRFQEQDVNVV